MNNPLIDREKKGTAYANGVFKYFHINNHGLVGPLSNC